MHVLLVEDDPKLVALIREGFFNEQINLEIAYDGFIGKRILGQRKFDVIILDVNLSGTNGFDLSQFVKSNWSQTPVVMLTAPGMTQDQIPDFRSGADDYLSKPFGFGELLVKTKALARRSLSDPHSRKMQVYDLVIDLDSQVVKRADRVIDLSKREYALLTYLLLNKGKIVSRLDILEKVWDLHFGSNTNVIDVYVNYLRRKIDKGHEQKLIQTIIGRGYILRDS